MNISIQSYSHQHPLKEDCQNSTSSEGSHESPSDLSYFINKEKSELCKKYMEQGYCPYLDRCKFAHGKHQLRCNNFANNRYKTRYCGNFFKNGVCLYGQRCNFRHKIQSGQSQNKSKIIKSNFRSFFEEIKMNSRFFPQ